MYHIHTHTHKKQYLEHSVEFQTFPSPQEDNDYRRILSQKTCLLSSRHGPNLTTNTDFSMTNAQQIFCNVVSENSKFLKQRNAY